jgi:SAM-dependent methyltransferase
MSHTYSSNYQDPRTAAEYDQVICRSDHDPVWTAEQVLLVGLIRKHVPGARSARAVDFACGTGRILEVLKPEVGELTGLDISAAMLERAGQRVPGVKLVCLDVTSEGEKIPADIDLLTSFRFLLLAEPSLRERCFKALVARVKPGGVVMVNTHGNPCSFRFLATVKDRLLGKKKRLKAFSRGDMESLAKACGLRIVDARGCGFVPMSLQKVLPFGVSAAIEKALSKVPGLWRFGTNILFVLRPAGGEAVKGA